MKNSKNAKVVKIQNYQKKDIEEPFDPQYDVIRQYIRFAVRSYIFDDPQTGVPYNLFFIVLIDVRTDVILRFTGLEWYDRIMEPGSIRILSKKYGNKTNLIFITQMLNYIMIDNYDTYHIKAVTYLTHQAIEDFLNWYASRISTNNTEFVASKRPLPETVGRVMNVITRFCANLCHYAYTINMHDGMYVNKRYIDHQGNLKYYKVPVFHVVAYESYKKERSQDIPTKVVFRMLELARLYDPEIELAIASGLFAGLREGEVVSMYRWHALTKAKGVRVNEDGKVSLINILQPSAITLSKKEIGSIKKKREQEIFYDFVDIYSEIYYRHLQLIENKTENGYAPMFYNIQKRNGSYGPMSASSYRKRWKKIFNLAVQECAVSENPQMRLFAKLAIEQDFTPHSMRHWYSVYVATRVSSARELAVWRGDKNDESASTYLRNKEIIKGKARMAVDETAAYMRMMAKEGV